MRPAKPIDLVVGVKEESVALQVLCMKLVNHGLFFFFLSTSNHILSLLLQVTKGVGSYTVSGPHGSVEVLDNFTLADTVMEAIVGDKTVVTQLIARDASGGLRIRYKNRVSYLLNCSTISLGGIHGNIYMCFQVQGHSTECLCSPRRSCGT